MIPTLASSLHPPTPDTLARIGFVLVRPSHPGNVGACARAMRVMGLTGLSIVAPRQAHVTEHADAIAFASNAGEVLAQARVFDTLDEALAQATLVVGVSADAREFAPAPCDPEAAARAALDELDADCGHRVAFVFGTERTGLSLAQAQRCQLLCSIPGEPGYHSLNLSQAVQLIAYLLRREALSRSDSTVRDTLGAARRSHAGYASQDAIEAFYVHLERALVAIGFLDPAHPKKLTQRLRRLFARTRLEAEEVDLLRGVCTEAERAAARGGRRVR